uniref:G_PROTEIN_RECEP_F1_2 domain-containing protein n=1 Tax=Panagrellus redivivus TaxID=6233 RepID=A0A7E4VAB3_PANRE
MDPQIASREWKFSVRIMDELILENEIPSFILTLFSIFLYTSGALTMATVPFFTYAVIFKSGQKMSSYRYLLLAYVPFAMLSTIVITSTQPIFLRQVEGFYFIGFINVGRQYLALVTIITIMICDGAVADLLLVILVNRYELVSETIVTRSKYIFRLIYIFLFITWLISLFLWLVFMTHELYPPRINSIGLSITRIYVPYTVFYQLSRLISFFLIVYLNISFRKNITSKAVMKLHGMLTKAVIAHVLCTCILTRFPMLIVLIAVYIQNVFITNVIAECTICCLNVVFLSDMLVTFYHVKPYRIFVLQLFRRFTSTEDYLLSVYKAVLSI